MATKKVTFNFPTNNVKRVSGYFFLTDAGGSVVNGTLTITIVDSGGTTDVVNGTSSTLTTVTRGAGITSITVTTAGSDYPTIRQLTAYDSVGGGQAAKPPRGGGKRNAHRQGAAWLHLGELLNG